MKNKISKQNEAYHIFANFYDRLMNEKKYKIWDNLIVEIVHKYSIPLGVCLDIACGTGKISSILLEKGFQVIGVDQSKEMLVVARNNFPDVNFIESDIRDFTVAGHKQAVMAVSFYDSLNYLLTDEDMLKMFNAVKKNLAPGAIFLFDMNTREHVVVSQKNKPKVFELQEENTYTVFRSSGEDRIWVLDIDFFVKQNSGLYKLYQEYHIERGYDKEDILPLLKQAGFLFLEVRQENKIYDDGKEHPSRLYFVARA